MRADCNALRGGTGSGSMVKREPRVRRAQRLLDVGGPSRAREDEAQIARAFRQRHQQLIRLRRDRESRRRRRPRAPRRSPSTPRTRRARNRNHHHARRARSRVHRSGDFAERVAQQQLLERDWDSGVGIVGDSARFDRPDLPRRIAAPARRGRRSDAPRPRARTPPIEPRSTARGRTRPDQGVDAALGVNRPVPQTDAAAARAPRRRSRACAAAASDEGVT